MRWWMGERGDRMGDVARRELGWIPAFSRCGATELKRIDALSCGMAVEPGNVLVRAGERVRQIMVVIDGQVASTTADGRESIEASGHVIGAEELWGRRPAPATVRATTSVSLLVYGESEFRALLELPGVVEGLLGHSPTARRDVPATASSRPSPRPALASTLARPAAT